MPSNRGHQFHVVVRALKRYLPLFTENLLDWRGS